MENNEAAAAPTAYRMGNGTALHLAKTVTFANGSESTYILCNAWGTTNGTQKAPRPVAGAEATCKRCLKIAAAE